jgi:hypothetical protein
MSEETRIQRKRIQGAKTSPAVIVVAFAALLGFIAWLAWNNLLKPPGPPPFSAQEIRNHDILAALAKKCQGDLSKLSPEDQAVARKVAGRMAGRAIGMLYKNPNM